MFACVGGGGLLAGIAAYLKSIRPDVLVIGVEANDAAGTLSEARLPSLYIFFLKKYGVLERVIILLYFI